MVEFLRSIRSRIGRRGGALFLVGTLDLIFAGSLLILHNPTTIKVYGSILPLNVWALIWSLACLVAWVSMFLKSDRAGFSVSAVVLTTWGVLAIFGWLNGDNPAGWLGATFFLVLNGMIMIFATWPEPRESRSSVDNNYPDAIVTADDHGVITGWFGSAELMFGWRAEQVLGRAINVIIPSEYREAHEAGLSRVRETGVSELAGRVLDGHGLRRDGSTFPVRVVVGIHCIDNRNVFTATIRKSEGSL